MGQKQSKSGMKSKKFKTKQLNKTERNNVCKRQFSNDIGLQHSTTTTSNEERSQDEGSQRIRGVNFGVNSKVNSKVNSNLNSEMNPDQAKVVEGGKSTYQQLITTEFKRDRMIMKGMEKGLKSEKEEFRLNIDGSDRQVVIDNYLESRNLKYKRHLGSGNYATVYLVRTMDKKRMSFALKIIDLHKAESYRNRFIKSEIDTLQQIKHPNIIQTFDISQLGLYLLILMEYAKNGTMADLLAKKGAFDDELGKIMFRQIVDGLHYMHSNKYAHRDLKLENILLDRNYTPKLADFTLAKNVSKGLAKLSQTFCGTLPYLPPEIMANISYDPLIADIWSLGVCCYVIMNDGLPFSMGNDAMMYKKQLARNWTFKRRVEHKLSSQCKDIIKKMLEPDVNFRITTAKLLAHPWIANVNVPKKFKLDLNISQFN